MGKTIDIKNLHSPVITQNVSEAFFFRDVLFYIVIVSTALL